MTNLERIKNLNVENLASLLIRFVCENHPVYNINGLCGVNREMYYETCDYKKFHVYEDNNYENDEEAYNKALEHQIKWLQSESEDN